MACWKCKWFSLRAPACCARSADYVVKETVFMGQLIQLVRGMDLQNRCSADAKTNRKGKRNITQLFFF